jgi:hypothetical protein
MTIPEIPVAAAWLWSWNQPPLRSPEWRVRQLYSKHIGSQMEAAVLHLEISEMIKALASPGRISPPLEYGGMRLLARERIEYKFSQLSAVINALGLLKHWRTEGDSHSRATHSQLGKLLAKCDSFRTHTCGISVEFRIKGRGNARRYVVVLG